MNASLYGVVIDCPDPHGLATFYSQLLATPIIRKDDEWVGLQPINGVRLEFQLAPNLQAPEWPNPDKPQQFHLDIDVSDIDEAEPEVLALGARRLPGEGDGFRVYADPANHPFCLVWDHDD